VGDYPIAGTSLSRQFTRREFGATEQEETQRDRGAIRATATHMK